MATARKLPSGKWRVLIYSGKDEEGKRQYESFTADTKREAEFQASEWARTQKSRQRHNKVTLRAAYTQYIESKQNILSPSTIREYKRSAKHDLQGLMDLQLSEVTPELIQIEINKEALSHSPKSLRNMHGLLSAVMAVYRPEMRLNTTLPKKEKPTIYVPTDEDIKKLVEGVRGKEIEIPILLAAFGSLRRSEIGALEASDFTDNAVVINKALVVDENKKWVTKGPKSEAGYRTVILPAEVINRIPRDMEGKIVKKLLPSSYLTAFHRELDRLGLPRFRFHDLRHYQASILHALGVPDKYIMRRGGWTTDSTLKNIYQHTMGDKEKEFTNIANSHFSKLMNEDK